MKQRDMMRLIWHSHGDPPDLERVIGEYAAREEAGEVARDSSRFNVPPLEYARRLLDDGLRKGWLTGALRDPVTRPQRIGAPKGAVPEARTRVARGMALRATAAIPTAASRTWLEWGRRRSTRPRRRAGILARVRVLLVAESHVAEQPGMQRCPSGCPGSPLSAAPLPE